VSRPELLLSNQLCFLVYRLEREISARYRPLLQRLGLTYPQYLAMLVLWEQDGRTVTELCRLLGLDTGTVSPLLRRLEQAGLLKRCRNRGDERSVVVELSLAGKKLEEQAASIPAALASCLGIGTREYAGLHRTFSDVLAKLPRVRNAGTVSR